MTTRPVWEKSHRGQPYKKANHDTGNKHSFEDSRVPPDNIGNHDDIDPIASFVHDGLGNTIDGDPAHLQSGVLMEISPSSRKQLKKPAQSMNRGRHERVQSFAPARGPALPKIRHESACEASLVATVKKQNEAPKLDLDLVKQQKSFSELWSKKRGTPLNLIFPAKNDDELFILSEDDAVNFKNLIRELLIPQTLFCRIEPVMYDFFNRHCTVFYVSMETLPGVFSDGLLASLRLTLNPLLHEARLFDCFIALDEEKDSVERTMMKALGKIIKRRKIADALPVA